MFLKYTERVLKAEIFFFQDKFLRQASGDYLLQLSMVFMAPFITNLNAFKIGTVFFISSKLETPC